MARFGSRLVYFLSLVSWSVFTLLQGGITLVGAGTAVFVLFALRALVGVAEAPSFPANARIVTSWFPANERGTASAIFNSAQYLATAVFAPIMGVIITLLGWPWVFYVLGGLGILIGAFWLGIVYEPAQHPWLGRAELAHIQSGGALIADRAAVSSGGHAAQLLRSRMFLGVCIGQYCISTLTYFFLTWFPVYLVQQRGLSILNAGLVASVPALCGFAGGILGGLFSDGLLRRGVSLTAARKVPIVMGMILSMTMIGCNYVTAPWAVVVLMALAFLGKGIGALGWAVVSDIAPPGLVGLSGGCSRRRD